MTSASKMSDVLQLLALGQAELYRHDGEDALLEMSRCMRHELYRTWQVDDTVLVYMPLC